MVSLANLEGNTPLHWACTNAQKEAARILMQHGASASALNRHDQTPMDEALVRDLQDIVNLINEFNAPSKDVAEVDDVPDDAEDAGDEDDGMAVDDTAERTPNAP